MSGIELYSYYGFNKYRKNLKKITTLSIITLAIIGITILQACKEDGKNTDPTPSEFVADDNTFSKYMSFPVGGTFFGANPALGGMAHGGNDSSVTRIVHYLNNQDRVNGKFPLGTVIVKRATSPAGMNETTAMVKRGNNFNPNVGDWEFFMLSPLGGIAKDSTGMPMRGANLIGGMCGGCHSAAASKDFIFSK